MIRQPLPAQELRPRKLVIVGCLMFGLVGQLEAQDSQLEVDQEEAVPQAAPGLVVVDEDAAVRALESALERANVLLLTPGSVSLRWSLSVGSDSFSSQFLVDTVDEDGETDTILATDRTTRTRFSTRIGAEFGLPYGLQVGLSVPFSQESTRTDVSIDEFIIEEDTSRNLAPGDLELSLQKVLLTQKGRRPDIIAGLVWDTASGSADGFGSEQNEYSLSLTATTRQDPLVFSGTLSRRESESVQGANTAPSSTSFSFGAFLAASPYTSLQLQFEHTSFATAGDTGEFRANRGNSGVVTLGGSSVIGRRTSLSYVVSAGLSDDAEDYVVFFGVSRKIR